MPDLVTIERRDSGVAMLRLHNPPVNALSRAVLDELAALVGSRRTWALNLVDLLLWVGLVFTMVVKPFS